MSEAQESTDPSGKVEYSIVPMTKDDIPSYLKLQAAAFSTWPPMRLMHPPSPTVSSEERASFALKQYAETLTNDTTAIFMVAKTPSGEMVGGSKWNFFPNTEPQFPWPKESGPGANAEMIKWYFDELDEKRNARLKGKKHALMATLVVSPKYQRCGVGKALLEWGLKRCDDEGIECWIDGTPEGKGLYLKHGWEQVDFVEIDLGRWGGEERVMQTANMVRKPRSVPDSSTTT